MFCIVAGMADFVRLGETTRERFYLACSNCKRRGRYRRATLLAVFGPDMPLPSVPAAVAKWRGCRYADNPVLGAAPWCGAMFDLATQNLEDRRRDYVLKHLR